MTTQTQQDFKSFGDGYLPGLVGVEIVTVTRELVESRMAVRREVMAPNGFLHAASVIALADTSCGAPRPHHPGLGRGGHQRGERGQDRAIPVHADGFVAESASMSFRFFFAYFYFPCNLAEGTG